MFSFIFLTYMYLNSEELSDCNVNFGKIFVSATKVKTRDGLQLFQFHPTSLFLYQARRSRREHTFFLMPKTINAAILPMHQVQGNSVLPLGDSKHEKLKQNECTTAFLPQNLLCKGHTIPCTSPERV